MKRKWKFIVPTLILLGTFLLFQFVLFIGYVPTESMEPTILKGSYILGCRFFGELKVGDIIVFEHEGKQVVKRIAAMCGDTVEHKGDVLIVPDGKIYVLGDNKDNSADSRSWVVPFIDNDSIIATVVWID